MAHGDRVFIHARGKTGVRSWEVSPCLEHYDPHGPDAWTESYATLEEAQDASYEGTGAVFWGVYANMLEAVHSDVITPTMHLLDFDSPDAALEFVRAVNGLDGVTFTSEEDSDGR